VICWKYVRAIVFRIASHYAQAASRESGEKLGAKKGGKGKGKK
jgi:hypothetical protein